MVCEQQGDGGQEIGVSDDVREAVEETIMAFGGVDAGMTDDIADKVIATILDAISQEYVISKKNEVALAT